MIDRIISASFRDLANLRKSQIEGTLLKRLPTSSARAVYKVITGLGDATLLDEFIIQKPPISRIYLHRSSPTDWLEISTSLRKLALKDLVSGKLSASDLARLYTGFLSDPKFSAIPNIRQVKPWLLARFNVELFDENPGGWVWRETTENAIIKLEFGLSRLSGLGFSLISQNSERTFSLPHISGHTSITTFDLVSSGDWDEYIGVMEEAARESVRFATEASKPSFPCRSSKELEDSTRAPLEPSTESAELDFGE